MSRKLFSSAAAGSTSLQHLVGSSASVVVCGGGVEVVLPRWKEQMQGRCGGVGVEGANAREVWGCRCGRSKCKGGVGVKRLRQHLAATSGGRGAAAPRCRTSGGWGAAAPRCRTSGRWGAAAPRCNIWWAGTEVFVGGRRGSGQLWGELFFVAGGPARCGFPSLPKGQN
eukprot:362261-Chlamydomonas_euryale.AAC.1